MFRHNNFACGLCISIVALTATMCLYNVSREDELVKRKKQKTTISNLPDQYLPTPLEHQRETVVQQIFTLVPKLNPSLGFVTAQEIWSTENTNNNNKKQRRNLDSGAFRPRITKIEVVSVAVNQFMHLLHTGLLSDTIGFGLLKCLIKRKSSFTNNMILRTI